MINVISKIRPGNTCKKNNIAIARIAHFTNWATPISTSPSSERTNLRTIQNPRAAPARMMHNKTNTETCLH